MKKLAIIVAALATAFSGIMPAQAFPVAAAPRVEVSQPAQAQPVEQVQYRRHHRGGWRNGGHSYRPNRHYRGRHNDRYYGRHYRRGPGAGAIIGGLAAGAIIGGALSQPRYSSGGSHANSCYSRYRSYRASDNTYQPTNGPRRQCVSR